MLLPGRMEIGLGYNVPLKAHAEYFIENEKKNRCSGLMSISQQ